MLSLIRMKHQYFEKYTFSIIKPIKYVLNIFYIIFV